MKGDFLPLQTSLTSPNFPARQPPFRYAKFFSVLKTAVAAQGSFWWIGEVRGGIECGYRDRFVGEKRSAIMPFTSAEIPPASAPSGFDSAAFFDFIVMILDIYAAPLRMTQWGIFARVVQYKSVKVTLWY